jgi:hypothetical protein
VVCCQQTCPVRDGKRNSPNRRKMIQDTGQKPGLCKERDSFREEITEGKREPFLFFFFFFFFFPKTESGYIAQSGSCVAQAGLELSILLSQPPKCRDYKHVPLPLALFFFFLLDITEENFVHNSSRNKGLDYVHLLYTSKMHGSNDRRDRMETAEVFLLL